MTTLLKIITTLLLSLFLTSCQWDVMIGEGKKGNGNVVTESRNTNESFTVIKASEGLDVYVTQDDKTDIRVEADENIIEFIRTDIKNGVLRIHTEERIGRAKSKKVYVSLPEITALYSNSGADLYSIGLIKVDELRLDSSSGADIEVEVDVDELRLDSSSGADIEVSGKADFLFADASSGSDIKATNLTARKCIADVSSGADISVNVTDELTADASSGGDVHYSGNPEIVKKDRSSAGRISKN
ncbi:head GIN domain-containing protein [Leptobacterium sp. I13]|uniref:head GIN domain-containing protein n=1 Tax=Leptobacterium meishanense TaxID=3128904 RepID=UPI0030ED37AF